MRKLLLFLTMVLLFVPVFAQNKGGKSRGEMFKEIQEYKMKFLAQEIELKEDQKERFNEVYDDFMKAKQANFKEMRRLEKSLKSNASETDYKEVTEKISNLRIKDAELEKEYDAKFATFLNPKQIYKLKSAEDKFRRKMMEMHRKGHPGNKSAVRHPAKEK